MMEVQNQILTSAGETVGGLFALLKKIGFKPVAFSDSFDEISWDQRQRDLKNNKDFCFCYRPLP